MFVPAPSISPCTLWVNPFFLCRRKKGFVDPFIVIEWIQSRDADLLFYLGCQNLWTHPQRKHLSTQLAAPGTIFFYVVSLLRLVVLGLWFLTISCVVVCKMYTSHSPSCIQGFVACQQVHQMHVYIHRTWWMFVFGIVNNLHIVFYKQLIFVTLATVLLPFLESDQPHDEGTDDFTR